MDLFERSRSTNKTRKPDAEMVEAQKIDKKIFFQRQEFTVRPLYFLRICKVIGICKFQNPHKFRNEKSHHNPFGTMDRRIESSIWNVPQSHIMQRQEHALWDTGSSAITLGRFFKSRTSLWEQRTSIKFTGYASFKIPTSFEMTKSHHNPFDDVKDRRTDKLLDPFETSHNFTSHTRDERALR